MRDRLQMRVEPELLRHFKTLCYLRGYTMTDIMTEYMEQWVEDAKVWALTEYGIPDAALDLMLKGNNGDTDTAV